MLVVTERAAQALKAISDRIDTQHGECLRLTAIGNDRVGLTTDVQRFGDDVVRHEDQTVLVVDRKTSRVLDGVKLKYSGTRTGGGFILLRKAKKMRRPGPAVNLSDSGAEN
jgi:Fe-S cluster assembly iron-binding protein IscA